MIHHTKLTDCTIHPSGWAAVPGTNVEVTALPVIDTLYEVEGGPIFARLNYDEALDVAYRYNARLLAPGRINDLRKPGVALQLLPYLGTPIAETELSHSELHDADVWRQIRALGWDGKQPVVGAGKHWVAGAPPGRSRLEGWDRDGAGPGLALWQPDMVAHNRLHFDDGTTTVLERTVGNGVDYEEPPATPPPAGHPPTVMLGDDGPAVGRWQRVLAASEKPIAWTTAKGTYRQWPDTWRWPLTIDDDFGPRTAAATECWQSRRGLVADAIVGAKTWAAALAEPSIPPPPDTLPAPPPSMPDAPPSIESATGSWRVTPGVQEPHTDGYLQARHYTAVPPGRAVDWIVLHSTENPIRPGVARQVARYFEGPNAPRASAHYVVDREAVIQCVLLRDVAWTAPGANSRGVQIEMVGQAMMTDWHRAGDDDRAGLAVLQRAARLVAELCRYFGLPLERVDAAGLLAGARGITTHAAVTAAWHRCTHVDPGGPGDRRWPWTEFLAAVRASP